MRIHIAQKGETLWTIANKYGVNFEELKNMNAQLSNPNMIMPGMKIKVPGTGGAVKKEMPTQHHVPKEVPKEVKPIQYKEIPVPQPPKEIIKEVPKEIIKEVPKEVPYPIYQPVMPQMPEIDINNYYTMHMNQVQAQVQQAPPPPPKEMPIAEEESPMPEKMTVMPEMPAVMPIQHMPCPPVQYCYTVPMMPICDPCYPYPHAHAYPYPFGYPQPMMMMPQVQGAMTQPMVRPSVLPGTFAPAHEMESSPWEESTGHMGMHPSMPTYSHTSPAMTPYMGMPSQTMPGSQGDCGCGGSTQTAGFYGPGYMQPMAYGMNPYGVMPYGSMPYGTMPAYGGENAMNPYAMPMRHSGEEDESAE